MKVDFVLLVHSAFSLFDNFFFFRLTLSFFFSNSFFFILFFFFHYATVWRRYCLLFDRHSTKQTVGRIRVDIELIESNRIFRPNGYIAHIVVMHTGKLKEIRTRKLYVAGRMCIQAFICV